MRVSVLAALCVAGIALAGAAQAQTATPDGGRWAVGATAGSDGFGADLKYSLSPTIVLRARAVGLDVSHSENSDGIHYNGKLKFGTVGGFVDWHPWANGWLVSGGVIGGRRQVDLNGSSNNNVTINGNTYTPTQIGTVYGRAKLPSAAGFIGAGYDSAFTSRSPLSFNVLAGVQLGGKPKVALASTGLLASTPQLQTDLRREEDNIRHDLNFAQYYPAISVGIAYRF